MSDRVQGQWNVVSDPQGTEFLYSQTFMRWNAFLMVSEKVFSQKPTKAGLARASAKNTTTTAISLSLFRLGMSRRH